MSTYASPGVYFEPIDQNSQKLTVLRTDIAAFIGIAQMGPVNVPTPVSSWEQFQSTFGDFLPNAYMAYCAKAFFENGGRTLYGVRVAAKKVETTTNLGVVQPSDGLSSIVHSTDGFAVGALATAQQTATASASGVQPGSRLASALDSASGFPQDSVVTITQTVPVPVRNIRVAQAADVTTNTLYWNAPLDAAFDLTQPIQFSAFQHMDLLVQHVNSATKTITWSNSLAGTFNLSQTLEIATGANASQGTLVGGDGNPTVLLQAQTPGVWGNSLSIFVARTSAAAASTGSLPQSATGVASVLTSIVAFDVGTLVKVYQPGVASQYRVVKSVDARNSVLVWDSPLTAPLNFAAEIWFESVEFNLSLRLNGVEEEIFSNLSLEPTSSRYIETAINASTSRFISAVNLHSTTGYPERLPDPNAPQLENGVLSLWGGRDGIAALGLSDFMGDEASPTKYGLQTLEDVDQVSIVCCPDILIEPCPAVMYLPPAPIETNPCLPGINLTAIAPQPTSAPIEAAPVFSLSDVANMQRAMIRHCESMQFRVALLDPPDFGYPRQQVGLGEVQSWRNQFDSSYAALYFPWVLVPDPLLLNNEVVRRIPPSGHAAGICALTDTTVGVFKAPANTELQWALDVSADVTAEMQGFLNPLGINCIRTFRGRGIRIYGARTLSSETSWMFLNVRRLMCMIEQALEIALQWAVFEPNSFYLWHKITLSANNFLSALWKQGALVGNTAAEAFFVQCNQKTNPNETTSLGQMLAVIGVAPTRPAEFVIFRIGKTQDTLQVQEQP